MPEAADGWCWAQTLPYRNWTLKIKDNDKIHHSYQLLLNKWPDNELTDWSFPSLIAWMVVRLFVSLTDKTIKLHELFILKCCISSLHIDCVLCYIYLRGDSIRRVPHTLMVVTGPFIKATSRSLQGLLPLEGIVALTNSIHQSISDSNYKSSRWKRRLSFKQLEN